MFGTALDFSTLATVLIGALIAGFTTGFAGFGSALVASGLWFHALPAEMVPPLVALASVIAQVSSLGAVRKSFDWARAFPYLLGGAAGVPVGVWLLDVTSPHALRTFAGVLLVSYATYQLFHRHHRFIGNWGGLAPDAVIGAGGGLLGGFAGLSGPLPLIWLQLRGGDHKHQRAVYQPFNLIVLALASLGMGISGQITPSVLWVSMLCFPATLLGAIVGARAYIGVSPRTFQRVVLSLLLLSGCILIWPALGF